jgi:hypothetical protein
MCNISGGFCKDYICIEAWGPGEFPDGGCGEDTSDYSFESIGCSQNDTDSDVVANEIGFTTALEHNKVDDYGSICGTGYTGGDLIYQIDLVKNQTITVTLTSVATTDGEQPYVMILKNGCSTDSSSCKAVGAGTVTYKANSTRTYYIVIDMKNGAFAKGTLTVTCN